MKKKLIVIILIPAMIFILSSCVSNTVHYKDADAEIWIGEMTGMMIGDITMQSWEVENSTGEHKTKSKMSVKIAQTTDGHAGTMEGIITGLIIGEKFEGSFTGQVMMVEGGSPVRGKFIGEFSDTKGSGSWVISADRALLRYTGKWTLKKQ
ncbi:MAG: hypothetical protein KAJ62_03845 [Desulfobacteraceae bacterium]|nr:hypothetical protein [Desulfobacteraceae bacterium]